MLSHEGTHFAAESCVVPHELREAAGHVAELRGTNRDGRPKPPVRITIRLWLPETRAGL